MVAVTISFVGLHLASTPSFCSPDHPSIGGRAISQAFPNYLIAKRNNINLVKETTNTAWWNFVRRFSRVFAESAEGDCYLLAKVPYEKPSTVSIWVEEEFPALQLNPKVKKVTCVDVRDNSLRHKCYSPGPRGRRQSTSNYQIPAPCLTWKRQILQGQASSIFKSNTPSFLPQHTGPQIIPSTKTAENVPAE